MSPETMGVLATAVTLLYTLLGLPSQIWKNYQNKSIEGISLSMTILLCLTFTTWVVYGWVMKDIYIIISNTTGGIGGYAILFQFFHFRSGRRHV